MKNISIRIIIVVDIPKELNEYYKSVIRTKIVIIYNKSTVVMASTFTTNVELE